MTQSPFDVIVHHMNAFDDNSMSEIVADYADDAIMVLPQVTFQGVEAIRGFFASQRMVDNPPKLESRVLPAEGSVVIAEWTIGAGSPTELRGRDVFVVTDGKIRYQTLYFDAAPTV